VHKAINEIRYLIGRVVDLTKMLPRSGRAPAS